MGYERRIKGIFNRGGKCEECGWDKHIEIIQKHHIYKDGKRTHKNIFLCPTCHAWQTYLDNTKPKMRDELSKFIKEWKIKVLKK